MLKGILESFPMYTVRQTLYEFKVFSDFVQVWKRLATWQRLQSMAQDLRKRAKPALSYKQFSTDLKQSSNNCLIFL